jgi:hypothetical protein
LVRLAFVPGDREAGDGHRLASLGIWSVLDLEKPRKERSTLCL